MAWQSGVRDPGASGSHAATGAPIMPEASRRCERRMSTDVDRRVCPASTRRHRIAGRGFANCPLTPDLRHVAILDRPRRHVHRHRRAPPRRQPRDAQAPLRQSGALPRRRGAGHPRAASAVAAGAPVPAGAIDAVKMGTTVATNALLERKGERTAARHHQGLRRRAAHRLPEPAEALRAPDRAAESSLRARDRGGRADRRARRGRAPARRGAVERGAARRARGRHPRGRDRADARLPLPAAREAPSRPSPAGSASRRCRCRTRSRR